LLPPFLCGIRQDRSASRKLDGVEKTFRLSLLKRDISKKNRKRITNRKLRDSFANIRNITEIVKEGRQLIWLEHVLKMEPKSSTRKLANAWVRNPRSDCHPQHNLRHSYGNAPEAISEIKEDPRGPLKEWTKTSVDLPKGHWRIEVKKRLRKWSAENNKTRTVERAAKRQRILSEEETEIEVQRHAPLVTHCHCLDKHHTDPPQTTHTVQSEPNQTSSSTSAGSSFPTIEPSSSLKRQQHALPNSAGLNASSCTP
jgi:hypothetical protein